MSHVALARKWRPQRFEDVIGQRGVVDTLKNAIATGRLAQSFIFAGPRGVGKTTTARILARALNCVNGPTPEPCGVCDACVEIAEGRDVDVLEIDGATYTGVDRVREVIVEPLGLAPMRDRSKIFIIDEVHRLSKQAFDALLKSIEEPPPYVRFMMATTEIGAVPATIQSRSQVFELRALPFASVREQLRKVTVGEAVKIDDGALALVARSAEGSMRDALSALDQVLAFAGDTVTASDVSTVLGVIGRDQQFELAETIAREDVVGAFELARRVVEAGYDLRIVCRELSRLMRDLMVVRVDPSRLSDPEIAAEGERDRLKALAERYSREDLMRAFDLISKAEFEIKNSSQPRHAFEMTLVKWIHLRQLTPLTDLIAGLESGARPMPAAPKAVVPPAPAPPRPQAPSVRPHSPGPATQAPSPRPQDSSSTTQDPRPRTQDSSPATQDTGPRAQEPRPKSQPSSAFNAADVKAAFLSSVREGNKTFYGMVVAQAQKIDVDETSVTFTFAPVHKTLKGQLEAKRAWVEQIAQTVSGRKLVVRSVEAEPVGPAATDEKSPDDSRRADLRARAKAEPAVQAVLDVFGGEIEDVEEI
jgi:DNA polymerase-3 subunit gamma/tau